MEDRKYRREHGRRAFVDSRRKQVEKYFEGKGLPVRDTARYVLNSHASWPSNIILERVARFIEHEITKRKQEEKHFALHTFVHHGLSSQALLWNLLGPLVVDGRWDLLAELLQTAGIPFEGQVSEAEFEVENSEVLGEKGGQPTSVDLRLQTSSGGQVFVEFKFTEADFGGCSVFRDGDCDGRNPANEFDLCYLNRIGRKYWPLMQKHGLLDHNPGTDSQCPFSSLYQAYRLVLYALEQDGHLLLIHDERNPAFMETDHPGRGLFVRVLESLPEHARARCHILSVQQVIGMLERHGLDWLTELKGKHF